jgi:hypothetical protein
MGQRIVPLRRGGVLGADAVGGGGTQAGDQDDAEAPGLEGVQDGGAYDEGGKKYPIKYTTTRKKPIARSLSFPRNLILISSRRVAPARWTG